MNNQNNSTLVELAKQVRRDILEVESVNTEAAFERVCRAHRAMLRSRRQAALMKIAAILSVPFFLLSLLMGYLYFDAVKVADENLVELVANKGSVISYELPDHSKVWLNSGSKLRFPSRFKSSLREVELEGEAFFEVDADKNSPFYVNTDEGLKVYVYGTRFNVSAYEADEKIAVTLEKGCTNVIIPELGQEYTMTPGECLIYTKTTGCVSTEDSGKVYENIAWKDGTLVFRDAGLDEIFDRLERHFNVKIIFNNPNNKDYRYRATFRNETLAQILDYLSRSASMRWEMKDERTDESSLKIITVSLD